MTCVGIPSVIQIVGWGLRVVVRGGAWEESLIGVQVVRKLAIMIEYSHVGLGRTGRGDSDRGGVRGNDEDGVSDELRDTTISRTQPSRVHTKTDQVTENLIEKMQQRKVRKETERKARKAAFDEGLIGPGGVAAPGVRPVLVAFDLNIHPLEAGEIIIGNATEGMEGDDGYIMSQGSNPFNRESIIEECSQALRRKKCVRRVLEEDLSVEENEVRSVRKRHGSSCNEAKETRFEVFPKAP